MKKILIGIIIVALVGVGAWMFLRTTPTASQESGAPAPSGSTQEKFEGSRYAPFAVQIAPGPLSAAAQKALTGFEYASSTLPDGSIDVTLTAKEQNYQSQHYTVAPGQTLYFVEAFAADDASGTRDASLRDDTAILVDQNGYIVR